MAGSLVPAQHGAWAFLALPIVAGAIVAPSVLAATFVVAVAWLCAYPTSYAVLSIVRTRASRRPEPSGFYRILVPWGSLCAVACIIAVDLRPYLAWVGVGYAVAFGINVAFARRRNDRALINDAVFIVECTAMTWVIWAVGTEASSWSTLPPPPVRVWIAMTAVAVALMSSTLHVKSLIRERHDRRYERVSLTFSAAAVALSVGLAAWWGWPWGAWLIPGFSYLLGRSVLARRRRSDGRAPRPAVIGMTELGAFVLIAAGLAAAAVD